MGLLSIQQRIQIVEMFHLVRPFIFYMEVGEKNGEKAISLRKTNVHIFFYSKYFMFKITFY